MRTGYGSLNTAWGLQSWNLPPQAQDILYIWTSLSPLHAVGWKGKESDGLGSCQQSHVKNGIRHFRTVIFLGIKIIRIYLFAQGPKPNQELHKQQESRLWIPTCAAGESCACFPLKAGNEKNKASSPACNHVKCIVKVGDHRQGILQLWPT